MRPLQRQPLQTFVYGSCIVFEVVDFLHRPDGSIYVEWIDQYGTTRLCRADEIRLAGITA